MGRACKPTLGAAFLSLRKLSLQGFGVAQNKASYDLPFPEGKQGKALIAYLRSRAWEAEQLPAVSPGVGQAGSYFLPFGDELLDVVVKIGKRRADALPILLESGDSLDRRADRPMKNNIGRDEFF